MIRDLYTIRSNDTIERANWRNSGLVPVDTLRKGTVFECISGLLYQFTYQDDSNGVCHGDPVSHGRGNALMCSSALVRVITKGDPIMTPARTITTRKQAEETTDSLNSSTYDLWSYETRCLDEDNNNWIVIAIDEDGNEAGTL